MNYVEFTSTTARSIALKKYLQDQKILPGNAQTRMSWHNMFSVSQCDGYVQKCSNDIQALSNGKIGVFDHIR